MGLFCALFKAWFMYYVYCLPSIRRNYMYVRLTNDIDRRVEQHQAGMNKTTRAYRPFELFYFEQFQTRAEARKREKYFKSGIGKEKLRNILKSRMQSN